MRGSRGRWGGGSGGSGGVGLGGRGFEGIWIFGARVHQRVWYGRYEVSS